MFELRNQCRIRFDLRSSQDSAESADVNAKDVLEDGHVVFLVSIFDSHPRRGVVRGAFPVAWCGVDAGIMQGEVVAAQGQVDAHADVAAQAAHAIVPPAELLGVRVQRAVSVFEAEREDVL